MSCSIHWKKSYCFHYSHGQTSRNDLFFVFGWGRIALICLPDRHCLPPTLARRRNPLDRVDSLRTRVVISLVSRSISEKMGKID